MRRLFRYRFRLEAILMATFAVLMFLGVVWRLYR
jgi:hypothetical protein